MSKRMFFIPSVKEDCFYEERYVEFKFYTGFALSQKQKSIESMHTEILNLNQGYLPFEVSRKSKDPIGQKLSAFNLMYFHKKENKDIPIENVFQSSKAFEFGGPYSELLYVSPVEAKKCEKLKTSGRLIKFICEDEEWDLLPYSMFYDWIYINALYKNKEVFNELIKYNAFTDIEFNDEKSKNCQARSVAIAVSLYKKGLLEKYLTDKELFKTIYTGKKQSSQISMF